MKLYYREIAGIGNPILVLHGLFGSSKNWITNGKELSSLGHVYLLDLRNHGDSPHSSSHKLIDMVDDLKEFLELHSISNPVLLGHSMGGLVSMLFALLYPQLVYKLIVVDIAPKSYKLNYKQEFAALKMDVSHYKSREEIDRDMEKILPDSFIRKFLQMNLERLESGGYRWKLNVQGLENSRSALEWNVPENAQFSNEVLFVFGENSDYVSDLDTGLIYKFFPNSHIKFIPNAGHYLHYTHSSEFLSHVKEFLLHKT